MTSIHYRFFIAIFGLLALIYCIYLLVSFFPPDQFLYVPCLFHLSTGLHCPGCGSTRAVSSFLHGDILHGLKNNLLIVLWGPYIIYRSYSALHTWIDGVKRTIWSPPKSSIIFFLVLTITYTILRNLPFEPFTRLFAPID